MKDDTISRQAAIETVRKAQSIGQAHRMLLQLPPAQPTCTVFVPVDDCISRQAALDAVDLECEEFRGIFGRIEKRIKALPPAQPGWIPCSERLPYAEYGESDTVLTTCGYRDVEDTSVRWIRLLYFNGGNWCYPTGETYEAKVYAWMPLPKPWEGDEK